MEKGIISKEKDSVKRIVNAGSTSTLAGSLEN